MPRFLCKAEALYDFESNAPESLRFQKGDCIDVYRKLPSGWWDGRCNGNKGWFPSNFVQIVQENDFDYCDSASSDIASPFTITANPLFSQIDTPISSEKLINGDTNSFMKNELTYKKLSDHVRSVINTLTVATRTLDYNTYATNVIDAIRYTMITTGSIYQAPKESLKGPRQSVITLLSELVVSAHSKSVAKLFLTSQDLLWAIQHFLKCCETNRADLFSMDSIFCLPPDWTVPKIMADQNLTSDLIVDLESRGRCVQRCIKLFLDSLRPVALRSTMEDTLLSQYRQLLQKNDLFLSAIEKVDYKQVTQSPFLGDLKLAKQKLYSGLCLLFITVQSILDESVFMETVLIKTQEVLESILQDVQPICKIVAELVIEQKKYQESLSEVPSKNSSTATHSERISLATPTKSISLISPSKSTCSTTNMSKKLPSIPLESPTSTGLDWLIGHDYAEDEIVFTDHGQVLSGSLPALVERATLHSYLDTGYNSVFFLTYRTFCTPEELIDLLDARYHIQAPSGLTVEQFDVWKRKKQKPIQLRVCNMIKHLIDQDYDEQDSAILDRLLVFAERSLSYHFESLSKRIRSSIMERKDSARLKRWVSTQPLNIPEPILPRQLLTLMDIEPIEMSRQLTLIDSKFFRAICAKEWFSGPKMLSDKITRWVIHELTLHPPGSKKRKMTYKYWINVAKKCRQLNNFNTCMAILAAMGKSETNENYRNLILSITLPSIPFIDIFLQDLRHIASEPDFLNQHINFDKRSKMGMVILDIQHFQSTGYALKEAKEIQDFIWKNLNRSYQDLKLEQREEMNEKIARLLQEFGFT